MKNVWCCALVSVALTETITSGCCAASREDVFSARKDRQIGAVKIDEIYQAGQKWEGIVWRIKQIERKRKEKICGFC